MHSSESVNDKELFFSISQGNEDAFKILFERYKSKVYLFISSIVKDPENAKELTQEVFMRIWISRFALEGVKDPGNYLFVIAKNRTLDYLRKEKMDFSMRKEFSAQAPNFDESSEDRLIFNENRRIVEEAIDALPQQQKAIYLLSRHEGLTREQIASQMNISVHTVKNHLTDAIKNIKKYLLSKDIMVLVFFTAGILK